MGTIRKALAWSGSGAELSLFVVSKSTPFPLPIFALDPAPRDIKSYVLEDADNALPGLHTSEHVLRYPEVPDALNDILRQCLRDVRAAGAEVAWFGFEGSFDFGHLLTEDFANQVYAVGDRDGIALATDNILQSKEWQERVVHAGKQVRSC